MGGEYERRRDPERTPEPTGSGAGGGTGDPAFVIQEHDASSRHFDLRLEIDGALKSWAVPKGPSLDPSEKRMATPTEDHPLDYRDFEGVIPEGQYGAGAVIVWDRGSWRNETTDDEGGSVPAAEAVAEGHVRFRLEGTKLAGGWALTRTGMGGADEERWLLVKVDDESADARRNPVSTQRESVLSSRTVEQVAEEEGEGG